MSDIQTQEILPKQKRARETRGRILTAALELLEEFGIEKVSTNAIAKRGGVNIASLYKYFPDKYAILRELALTFARKQSDLICEYLDGEDANAPIEKVCCGLVDALIEGTRGDMALVQLQRSLIVMPELLETYRSTNLDIGRAMQRFLDKWGVRLEGRELELSMMCLGETSSALQDLALSRDGNYDPAVIRELKFLTTSYYKARAQAGA